MSAGGTRQPGRTAVDAAIAIASGVIRVEGFDHLGAPRRRH